MTKITPNLLEDTFNLVALARETALARGSDEQAKRFTPVVDGLRELVVSTREACSKATPTGCLAQSDFQTLLNAVQSKPEGGIPASTSVEKYRIVSAMSAGGMSDTDIARQLGMSQEEIRLILSASHGSSLNTEGSA